MKTLFQDLIDSLGNFRIPAALLIQIPGYLPCLFSGSGPAPQCRSEKAVGAALRILHGA